MLEIRILMAAAWLGVQLPGVSPEPAVWRSDQQFEGQGESAVLLASSSQPSRSPGLRSPTKLSASAILQRSEKNRSPEGNYAVDFTITVRDDRIAAPVRTVSFAMLVHGREQAIVLMLAPQPFYGGSLLIAFGEYWLLLPRADRPLQLSRDQVLRGDVANGDLARSNLAEEYRPHLEGEESIEGEPCFRLELIRARSTARYSRILCWVSTREQQTRKLEFYGLTGSLLSTARYRNYRKTSVGVLPVSIEISSGVDPHQKSTIAFSDARAIDLSKIAFTPAGLEAFKTAALRLAGAGEAPPRLEAILARLVGDDR